MVHTKRRQGEKSLQGTHRERGRVEGSEIRHTNRGIPPSQGGIPGDPPPLHKFVRISRLRRRIWFRGIWNFFREVGEEPKRQKVVAPSLRPEIFLWTYLEEASRSSHCKGRRYYQGAYIMRRREGSHWNHCIDL